MSPVFRTFSFMASVFGVVAGIAAMFWAKGIGRPDYVLVFAGNSLLCAIGAVSHWYLHRLLTPKTGPGRKDP